MDDADTARGRGVGERKAVELRRRARAEARARPADRGGGSEDVARRAAGSPRHARRSLRTSGWPAQREKKPFCWDTGGGPLTTGGGCDGAALWGGSGTFLSVTRNGGAA